MLPDFPKSKNEVMRRLLKRIQDLEKEQHPILGKMKTFRQYEGETMRFEQMDYGKKVQQAEHQYASVKIGLDEIPTMTGDALDKKLSSLADQSGAHKMKLLFARIEEDTEQTGNRINAAGRPIDASVLLDMIDMADPSFDKSGKSKSSFLAHPNTMPALKKASEEVENDPELKRRLESINSKKLKQWIDRENRRKLVD